MRRDDGVDAGPNLLPDGFVLVRCNVELEDLREREVALLVGGKGPEAAHAKVIELVKGPNVHDKRLNVHVDALHVWDGHGVVHQSSGHVLGHELLQVLAVVEFFVHLLACVKTKNNVGVTCGKTNDAIGREREGERERD